MFRIYWTAALAARPKMWVCNSRTPSEFSGTRDCGQRTTAGCEAVRPCPLSSSASLRGCLKSPDSRQILSGMCSLQLPESWMKPVPRSVNLALAGLFKHPLKEVTAFLSAEGLGVSTPVPRGVRHRWPFTTTRPAFQVCTRTSSIWALFRGNCPPVLAGSGSIRG